MASDILGRKACPISCGHAAAHVKIKTDKPAGKTALAYVHCPNCGVQVHARNNEQHTLIVKDMRAEQKPESKPDNQPGASAPAAAVISTPKKSSFLMGVFSNE